MVAPIKPGYGPAGVGEVAREGLSNQQIRSAFCPTNPTALCHSRNVSAATGLNLGVLMWSCVMSLNRPFDQPVPPPNGGPARTLRDAANYGRLTSPKTPKNPLSSPKMKSGMSRPFERDSLVFTRTSNGRRPSFRIAD